HKSEAGPLLEYDIKPNMKTLGPKLGSRLKDVQSALAAMSPAVIADKVTSGQPLTLPLEGDPVTLEPTDLWVQPKAHDGWVGMTDRGTQLALDTRITDDLALEGMAREVIRHVQQARKDAGLEMEDRIVLYLHTDKPKLQQAIDVH